VAVAVRKKSDDRMLNANIANVPGFVEERCNGDSEMHHFSLKKRRIGVRRGAMNGHTVQINRRAQARQMEGKALHLHLAAQRFAGLLLRRFQKIVVEPLAVQEYDHPEHDQHGQSVKAGKNPDRNSPPESARLLQICSWNRLGRSGVSRRRLW
jgi:hypothetical protein